MKKVLIPTDFSINLNYVFEFAASFFKEEECVFYFLHVYTAPFNKVGKHYKPPVFGSIKDRGKEQSISGLVNTLEKIKRNPINRNHKYHVLSSIKTLFEEVEEIIREKKIDCLVMSTNNSGSSKKRIFGSYTVELLKKIKIPTLLVPIGYSFRTIKSVLLPTDYWSNYKKEELDLGLEILKKSKAKLKVLHLKENYQLDPIQQENKRKLYARLCNLSHTLIELRDGLRPKDVLKYLSRYTIDLVVIMQRSHSGATQVLLPQNTDYLVLYTAVPILVIKDTSIVRKTKRPPLISANLINP